MSNALAVAKANSLAALSDEQIEILRTTVFKGLTNEEIQFATQVCNRTGLDPFTKQIHFVKRKNSKTNREEIAIQTAIDGFRLTAQRSGGYAGSDEPVFKLNEKGLPKEATVTVYRIVQGVRCPFTATARWEEFYPGDAQGFMWRKMPFVMLGKCAEAQALRKGFPAELSGMFSDEEMAQANSMRTVVATKAEEIQSVLNGEVGETDESGTEPDLGPQDPGAFVCKIGKKHVGKTLREFGSENLKSYLEWVEREMRPSADRDEFIFMAKAYLELGGE